MDFASKHHHIIGINNDMIKRIEYLLLNALSANHHQLLCW